MVFFMLHNRFKIGILIFLCCAAKVNDCWAQQMIAKYTATRVLNLSDDINENIKINLQYDHHNVFNDSVVFSYAKLRQLAQYPNGKVRFPGKEPNHAYNTDLCVKPLQFMTAIFFDSMMRKDISDPILTNPMDTCVGSKELWKFSRGFQPWQFLEQTKEINGIPCQRAQLYSRNGNLYWDLWFAPDIVVPGAPYGLETLPGLMIEGYCDGLKLNFSLNDLEMVSPGDPRLQLPSCFSEEFKYRGPMKPWTLEPKTE